VWLYPWRTVVLPDLKTGPNVQVIHGKHAGAMTTGSAAFPLWGGGECGVMHLSAARPMPGAAFASLRVPARLPAVTRGCWYGDGVVCQRP
jgi:hypothetical protein